MIKFKPENLNDTFRTFPRTLMDAFPEAPKWVEPTPLHEVVLYGLGLITLALLTFLLILS
jgi:hypothetical protein